MRGPEVMRTALWVNDLVSVDRNRGVKQDHQLPRGAVWSKARTQQSLDGLSVGDSNGAATWYDAICLNTERLQLAVVAAAVATGAQAANYVRAVRLSVDGSDVCGVQVRDELGEREFQLRAPVVINAAGPWVDEWLGPTSRPRGAPLFHASKAFNLLTRPLPFKDAVGLAIPTRSGPQTYFIIPWNGRSLVGTRHLRCEPTARTAAVTAEDVHLFLNELNGALGKHRIAASDVCGVFSGQLPEEASNRAAGVSLQKAPNVVEHAADGIRGLISLVGVKWTTARAVGERAARMACKRLGWPADTPVRRMLTHAASDTDEPRCQDVPQLNTEVAAHLEESYGSSRDALLALMTMDATLATRAVPDLPVMMAEIVHAARTEMAVRLSDVIRRRTPLYMSETLDRAALQACAVLLARELHWSQREIGLQVDEVEAEIAAFRGPLQRAARLVAA
jgi:glycerol-3-phosphate dehydrogenase